MKKTPLDIITISVIEFLLFGFLFLTVVFATQRANADDLSCINLEMNYSSKGKKEHLNVKAAKNVNEGCTVSGLVRKDGKYSYEAYLIFGKDEYFIEKVNFNIPNTMIGETFNWKEGKVSGEAKLLDDVSFVFRVPMYENYFLLKFFKNIDKNQGKQIFIGEYQYQLNKKTTSQNNK